MSIDRRPSFLQGFFRPFRQMLSKPQFAHLQNLVLAVVLNLHPTKLLHLAQLVPHRHRTRCGAFLSDSTWDAPALLEQTARRLLSRMKPKAGEVVYQMLDDPGIIRHLHLVCLVHLMLTHQSLQRLGAQATTPNKQVKLPTMQQRLHSLRQEAIRDQVRRLVKGPHHAKLRQKLCEHLLAAA